MILLRIKYVASMFSKYDFLSLPVVDRENRMVGIVTFDDAMDVIEEETTEDFSKMVTLRQVTIHISRPLFSLMRKTE